ncbi:MAG TPA: TldD/PmbA family protein, partial [Arenimonas sp.]|nr:TldD/PmbA family protein [Arenimonas sp.]
MDRRDFLTISGIGLAGLMLPYSRSIAAAELVSGLDIAMKKAIADAALEAATGSGASYCDVRIGRYLQQFVVTRED